MAVNNSSVLGASLSSSDTTKLFALGTKIVGTDNTEWAYCEATATYTTGQIVLVNAAGTAMGMTTALLNAPSVQGLDLGFAQFTVSQGEFAFFAKKGSNLYIMCTGTIAAGTGVAAVFAGRIGAMAAAAAGQTMAGIHITTSASTATASVAIATITWPRMLTTAGVVS